MKIQTVDSANHNKIALIKFKCKSKCDCFEINERTNEIGFQKKASQLVIELNTEQKTKHAQQQQRKGRNTPNKQMCMKEKNTDPNAKKLDFELNHPNSIDASSCTHKHDRHCVTCGEL